MRPPAMMTARQKGSPLPALRAYPVDSPQARARLLVLALLADGQLDEREVDALSRRHILHGLGISRAAFAQVLDEFCSDVAVLEDGSGRYRLSASLVEQAFAEVTERSARDRVLRMILALIASDGYLADGERALVRNAIAAWVVGADEPVGAPLRGRSMRRGRSMSCGA